MTINKAEPTDPLLFYDKIAGEDGLPTESFMRKWASQVGGSETINKLIAETNRLGQVKIVAGVGLGGGGAMSDDVINLLLEDTAVSPGSYGAADKTLTLTVDAQGRLTAVASQPIARSGNFVKISKTIVTTTTTHVDLSFNPALYTKLQLVVTSARPSVNGDILGMRVSTDGGTSFKAGVSDYALVLAGYKSSAASANYGDNAHKMMWLSSAIGNTSPEALNACVDIYGFEAGGQFMLSSAGISLDNTSNLRAVQAGGRYVTDTDEVSSIRVLMDGGSTEEATYVLRGLLK